MVAQIRSFGYERYPRREHWQALKQLSDSKMEPEQFIKHCHVTQQDLAKIVGCSTSTVSGWFCRGLSRSRRHPNDLHKLRLALVHKLWSKI